MKLAVVEALRGVTLDDGDVVNAGLVGGLTASRSKLSLELTLPGGFDADAAEALAARCEAAVEAARDALVGEDLLGAACAVDVTAAIGRRPQQEQQPEEVPEQKPIEATKRVGKVVAVSSCKGGVGKSTVAVNLAFALAKRGLQVGIVDADVHGPSLPTMVGTPDVPAPGEPYVRLAPETDEFGRELLEPLEKQGVKLMSFGFLAGDAPAMMRGSRVSGVVQQLATSVAWRDLDYLVVDMPPGTGDAQLTLCQQLEIDAAVVVTTPSRLAFADVVKGVSLFDEVQVPVVAVVENMAYFQLSADQAEREARDFLGHGDVADLAALLARPRRVFGEPHSRKLRDMWGIDHAFELPLAPDVNAASDGGSPLHLLTDLTHQQQAARDVIDALAAAVVAETDAPKVLPPVVDFDGDSVVTTYDGQTARVNPYELRLMCRCAKCVDEETGVVIEGREEFVPRSVRPITIKRNGNYAVAVTWSDGHQSLYPFKAFVPGFRGQQRADVEAVPA